MEVGVSLRVTVGKTPSTEVNKSFTGGLRVNKVRGTILDTHVSIFVVFVRLQKRAPLPQD